jgi:hypothetical protein
VRTKYPSLSQLAIDIFSVPAMSSEAERVFSTAGFVLNVRVRWFDHRCKVNSDEFDRVQKRTGGSFLSQVAG